MSNELRRGKLLTPSDRLDAFLLKLMDASPVLCSNIAAAAPVSKNVLIPRSIGHNLEQFSALVKSEATERRKWQFVSQVLQLL